MTFSINSLMRSEGASLFYSKEWINTVESHLKWFLSRPANQVMPIQPQDAYKYEADLTGLLQFYKIPEEYHYVIMRMNNMTSTRDYNSEILSLVIPDSADIEGIRTVFQTKDKKIN